MRVAKQYLSYFQGRDRAWECADQRRLRGIVPENRLRVYDVRSVIETLADTGSRARAAAALRPRHGHRAHPHRGPSARRRSPTTPRTSPAPSTAPAADKAARFMQLCDAFDLPLLFLCDTPGIMVGPEVEKTALVRHCCRMFVVGASLSVPFFTIVLRKAYGLGAQAMARRQLQGAAVHRRLADRRVRRHGPRRRGEARLPQGARRDRGPGRAQAALRAHGRRAPTSTARRSTPPRHFEIDDVIDPADSRRWMASACAPARRRAPRTRKKRPCIDTW